MKSQILRFSCLISSLALLLVLWIMLPSSSLASPMDPLNPQAGRYIGSFFGFCNREGKMCGYSSANQNDCCGALVCLLVPEQLGHYCMRDPTMPELYYGWFSDW